MGEKKPTIALIFFDAVAVVSFLFLATITKEGVGMVVAHGNAIDSTSVSSYWFNENSKPWI